MSSNRGRLFTKMGESVYARPPEDYLSKSYFQIWLAGLETLMIERGLVTREEIEAGKLTVTY